jgi:type VI secretion system secreted protein VgrG
VGGQARIHTGQAIGVLAGAIQPGADAAGKGLTVIAAQGAIDMQAQAGAAQVAAKQTLELKTAHGVVNIAAAKKVVLAVSGGASITIEGGSFTAQCPGKISVMAGMKSMVGGGTMSYSMPRMPASAIVDVPVKFNMHLRDVPGPHGEPLSDTAWRIVQASDESSALVTEETILSGTSDANGMVNLSDDQDQLLHQHYNNHPDGIWLIFDSRPHKVVLNREREDWTDREKLYHALDAMGYANDHDSVGSASVDDFHARLARADLKKNSPSEILKKLKEGF